MSPHKTKRENFIRAVARLDDAVQDYQQYHMESIRDGMIQRFGFSFELAWKALKEYMTEQGVPDLQFPKQLLQEAYAAGLIDDQAVWLEMHIYPCYEEIGGFLEESGKIMKEKEQQQEEINQLRKKLEKAVQRIQSMENTKIWKLYKTVKRD